MDGDIYKEFFIATLKCTIRSMGLPSGNLSKLPQVTLMQLINVVARLNDIQSISNKNLLQYYGEIVKSGFDDSILESVKKDEITKPIQTNLLEEVKIEKQEEQNEQKEKDYIKKESPDQNNENKENSESSSSNDSSSSNSNNSEKSEKSNENSNISNNSDSNTSESESESESERDNNQQQNQEKIEDVNKDWKNCFSLPCPRTFSEEKSFQESSEENSDADEENLRNEEDSNEADNQTIVKKEFKDYINSRKEFNSLKNLLETDYSLVQQTPREKKALTTFTEVFNNICIYHELKNCEQNEESGKHSKSVSNSITSSAITKIKEIMEFPTSLSLPSAQIQMNLLENKYPTFEDNLEDINAIKQITEVEPWPKWNDKKKNDNILEYLTSNVEIDKSIKTSKEKDVDLIENYPQKIYTSAFYKINEYIPQLNDSIVLINQKHISIENDQKSQIKEEEGSKDYLEKKDVLDNNSNSDESLYTEDNDADHVNKKIIHKETRNFTISEENDKLKRILNKTEDYSLKHFFERIKENTLGIDKVIKEKTNTFEDLIENIDPTTIEKNITILNEAITIDFEQNLNKQLDDIWSTTVNNINDYLIGNVLTNTFNINESADENSYKDDDHNKISMKSLGVKEIPEVYPDLLTYSEIDNYVNLLNTNIIDDQATEEKSIAEKPGLSLNTEYVYSKLTKPFQNNLEEAKAAILEVQKSEQRGKRRLKTYDSQFYKYANYLLPPPSVLSRGWMGLGNGYNDILYNLIDSDSAKEAAMRKQEKENLNAFVTIN